MAIDLDEVLTLLRATLPDSVFHDPQADELVTLLGQIHRIKNLVESYENMTVREIRRLDRETSRISRERGLRNTEEVIARVTGSSYAAAKRAVELADAMLDIPAPSSDDGPVGTDTGKVQPPPDPTRTAAPDRPEPARPSRVGDRSRRASQHGHISTDTLHLIIMSLHKISHLPTEKLIGIEAHWLELVTGDSAVGLSGLKSEIKRVIATFTRRIPQRTVEHHRSRRGLRLFTQDDGMVRLQGLLLPEAAAALARCFDVINTPVHTRLGRGDATTTSGDVENVVKDPRSAMQKNHDALVTVANAALTSSELPTPNGKPAVVLLHTTEDRAKDPDGTAVIAGHDGSPALIPASSVRQTACAGALQRLTLNSHGQPVALEHEQRCFTGHQRRAMAARDGGCIIPGCGIPPGWCEAHHVETWAATKRTRTGAGVLLCWFHHHTIETSGWKIRFQNDRVEVRPPNELNPSGGWIPASRGVDLVGAG